MRRLLFLLITFGLTSLVNATELTHTNPEGPMKNKLDKWKLLEVKSKNSDEIWFFRKNLGVASIKSNTPLQTLVYFTVKFKPKDSSGLPDEHDVRTLYNFEEVIIPIVEKDAKCVHVASVVKGGIKDHLFYVSDPNLFLKTIGSYQDKLKEFAVSIEQQNDPKWKVYDDFP